MKKGFTLIELLVVVAIIGILATVVLSSLSDARDRARDAAIKAALSQARTDIELYNLDYGEYNDGAGGTDCEADTDTFETSISDNGGTSTGCVTPTTGASYTYASTLVSNINSFCVDSTGFSGEVASVATAGVSCR